MPNADNWEVTRSRFVAYIDIMGFKDMVQRNSHDSVYEMMKRIDHRRKFNESVEWGASMGRGLKLVRTTTYSDSIMVYSKDDTQESLHAFICTISGLTEDLFLEGIPHKGAFAYGLMTLDMTNSIFFGQPLIDAFLLQEEVHFYGIIAHATAEEKMVNVTNINEQPFIYYYDCPLKGGSSKHWTIFPMSADFVDEIKEFAAESKALIDSINKLRFKTSGHLRRYIDNTEKYVEAISVGNSARISRPRKKTSRKLKKV